MRQQSEVQQQRRLLLLPATGAALLLAAQIASGWTGERRLLVHCADVVLAGGYLYALRRLAKAAGGDTGVRRLSVHVLAMVVFVAASVAHVVATACGARAVTGLLHPCTTSFLGKLALLISALRAWLPSRTVVGLGRGSFLEQCRPQHLVALSFAAAICVGTVLLTLPVAWAPGRSLSGLDALFTATSATCVTGLIVRDTPRDFSLFGLIVLLALIQTGGLGIMTLSAVVASLAGRRYPLRQRLALRQTVTDRPGGDVADIVRWIVRLVIAAELAGAVVLLVWAVLVRGMQPARAGFYGLFHAVSAFCNAGFALHSDSMSGFVTDWWLNTVIGTLILVGGLGLPVVRDLLRCLRARRRRERCRLTLHAKLALSVTAVLLLVGFAGTLGAERHATLEPLSTGDRVLAAGFQSVTSRTAGFNTLDIGRMTEATLLLYIVLMFVGACPGSTAGGMKTTTMGVLFLSTLAYLRGSRQVQYGHRAIGDATQRRSLAIAGLSLVFVTACTLCVLAAEGRQLTAVLFEVTSAFGTVGLSTGITPQLGRIAKWILCLAMFAGRVGPLTLAAGVVTEGRRQLVAYPQEEVMIG